MPPDSAAEPTPSRVWGAVSDRLEAFARAWKDGPPDLPGFAPTGPPVVRYLTLVELIKYDLDQRLLRQLSRPLDAYFDDFPELVANGPPCDLLYEDFHLRKRAGETVSPADYYQRFPSRAKELARLLGGTASTRSTSVFTARAPEDLKPGDRLDDFDLLALLGEGQFAKVFLARQTSMQRLVALKVSAHRGTEAQTLAQLDHPHIVRVYDQRILPEQGLHLVYMSYLSGGTLGGVLDHVRTVPWTRRTGRTLLEGVDASLTRRGEVPSAASPTRAVWTGRTWPATVCAIGAKLAAALAHAHKESVLHRDIKPANVLLNADGEPFLADFNIGCCSKVEGAGPSAFFGGTLPYMAPEHIEAFNPDHAREPESLDGRADVYGLAVTLWELLTGKNPFGFDYLRGSWPETLDALAAQRREGPSAEAQADFDEGDVPGLRDVLMRCLAAEPADRPTAAEMARELELCLKPATRSLIRPAPSGWRETIRRYPILSIFGVTLVPNLLASAFNIFYNFEEIIKKWPVDETIFGQVIQGVNGFFFPAGLFVLGLTIWPVRQGLRRLRSGPPLDPAELDRRRHRALRLGHVTAVICVACWLAAGVVWPVILTALVGLPKPGTGLYLHFLASFVVCGLIAATYPYFLVTYRTVRVIYPALFGSGGPGPADGPALRRVGRELAVYRVLAAAIPLAAVGVLAGVGMTNPPAVVVLCITGVGGSVMVYVLEGRIRSDLEALADMPKPD